MSKPVWLRTKLPSGDGYSHIRANLKKHNLNTVCESAKCPNISECWESGHATIMILGDTCTRSCKFCAVNHAFFGEPPDPLEPQNVVSAITKIGLKYIVLTSVTRDDLSDGGANHYAEVIKAIKNSCNKIFIEALIPDYVGQNLKTMLSAKPSVLAHNIETVSRLTPIIRDRRANYQRSLSTLAEAKQAGFLTKSSLLLGMGESKDEVINALNDLRRVSVDIVTLGQYLQPSLRHYPVARYLHPNEFESYQKIALQLGFKKVFSAPLVRSSYRAFEFI